METLSINHWSILKEHPYSIKVHFQLESYTLGMKINFVLRYEYCDDSLDLILPIMEK